MKDVEKLKTEIASDEKDALGVQKFAASVSIESNSDLAPTVEMIAEIKRQGKALDEKQQEWTAPLRQVIVSIHETFKPALEALKEAEHDLKDKIVAFVEHQIQEEDRVIESISALPECERETALAKLAENTIPKIAGLQIRKTEKPIVTDGIALLEWTIANLPSALLVNMDVVVLHAKKMQTQIPGFELQTKRIVAISTK